MQVNGCPHSPFPCSQCFLCEGCYQRNAKSGLIACELFLNCDAGFAQPVSTIRVSGWDKEVTMTLMLRVCPSADADGTDPRDLTSISFRVHLFLTLRHS
jgi:hypothetical protein